jgi:hypothetical protein
LFTARRSLAKRRDGNKKDHGVPQALRDFVARFPKCGSRK